MTKLTKAVVAYKRNESDELLNTILRETSGIIYKCVGLYNISAMAQTIRDEVIIDCKTFVLLKAIDDYDASKGTEFSTFLYWKLRHFLQIERTKLFRQKRKGRLDTRSFEEKTYDAGSEDKDRSLLDIIASSPTAVSTRARATAELHKIFKM